MAECRKKAIERRKPEMNLHHQMHETRISAEPIMTGAQLWHQGLRETLGHCLKNFLPSSFSLHLVSSQAWQLALRWRAARLWFILQNHDDLVSYHSLHQDPGLRQFYSETQRAPLCHCQIWQPCVQEQLWRCLLILEAGSRCTTRSGGVASGIFLVSGIGGRHGSYRVALQKSPLVGRSSLV